MIVDTHIHVTSRDHATYPIERGDWIPRRLERLLLTGEDLIALMDEAGVDRTVLVQATNTHGYDNAYAADMAQKYPARFSTVCCVNVSLPDAVERLTYWVGERRMGGVRLFNAMTDDDSWLDEAPCDHLIGKARDLGVPVTLVSRHPDLARVRRVLERAPDQPFALDHLGFMPNLESPPFTPSDEFLALADFPHLSLKFSAVNQWAVDQADTPQRDYFQRIVDRFGPRRLMWGSNYPVTRFRPYPELAALGKEPFDFLSEEERGWVMGGNALRLWPAP